MRCLLIAPLHFYQFAERVAKGLQARGYDVVLLNEEYPMSISGRVLGYFFTPLIRKTTFTYFARLIENETKFDLVVIIKGRGMSARLIQLFKDKCGRVAAYNYDSFKRNPAALAWFRNVGNFKTFDIDDAENYGLSLLHLFSDAQPQRDVKKRYLVSVIQRLHSDRLQYACRLAEAVPQEQRFIFLYEWSKLTLIIGFLRSPVLYIRMRKYISMTPLSYTDAMRRMSESEVTFDYAFPRQSGITVRCFEAQSLGVAILTNNRAAVDSGVFDNGSIAHLSADADPDTVRRLLADLAARPPKPKARTLDNFLDELLDDQSFQRPTPN